MNKRQVICCGCWRELAPGEGKKWNDVMPPWAEGGRYVCADCWDRFGDWLLEYYQARNEIGDLHMMVARKVKMGYLEHAQLETITTIAMAQGAIRGLMYQVGLGCLEWVRRTWAVLSLVEGQLEWKEVVRLAAEEMEVCRE